MRPIKILRERYPHVIQKTLSFQPKNNPIEIQ